MNRILNYLIGFLCRRCSSLYSSTFYDACDALARSKEFDKSRYPRAYATAWSHDRGVSLD